MHCAACANRIEGALSGQSGVVSAAVNFATTRAFVAYDPTLVGTEALLGAVADAGYSASPLSDGDSGLVEEDTDHWALRATISWVLAIAAFVIAVFGPETGTAGWSVLVLATAVEIAGGWPFLKATVRQARHGTTSMDTLISIGTLAALAVSAVEAIALGGRHVHLGGGGAFAARLHGVMAPIIIAILATGRAVERREEPRRKSDAFAPRVATAICQSGHDRRRRHRQSRPTRECPGGSARPGEIRGVDSSRRDCRLR